METMFAVQQMIPAEPGWRARVFNQNSDAIIEVPVLGWLVGIHRYLPDAPPASDAPREFVDERPERLAQRRPVFAALVADPTTGALGPDEELFPEIVDYLPPTGPELLSDQEEANQAAAQHYLANAIWLTEPGEVSVTSITTGEAPGKVSTLRAIYYLAQAELENEK